MFFPFDVSPLNQCYFCRHPAADTQSGRVFVRVMPQTALGSLLRRLSVLWDKKKSLLSPSFRTITFHYNHRGEPGGEGAGWRAAAGGGGGRGCGGVYDFVPRDAFEESAAAV